MMAALPERKIRPAMKLMVRMFLMLIWFARVYRYHPDPIPGFCRFFSETFSAPAY
jgi:hypothetical protein